MTELLDAIKQCEQRLQQYRRLGKRIGEQNTKAGLIEPVISALGWDVLDPDEVHREYKRRPADNPVDYALLLMRTPRLFIEAKGLGENLDDPKWANQTISYAAVAGVEWVALTDGAEWRVYNAHAPVPVEQKLFRAVGIADDVQAAAELLSLLSRDNMRDNRIQELWRSFFVDRQVHTALTDLFSGGEPARDLVALLSRRVADLSRADLRASLMRARATFDFPYATPASPPTAAPPPAAAARSVSITPAATPSTPRNAARPRSQPSAAAYTKVSAAERKLSLPDLIAAGRLSAGATLEAEYLGQRHTAELLANGFVRFRGEEYRSLSRAGRAVKIVVVGADTPETTLATDGWEFWRATDAVVGDVQQLKVLRRRLAEETAR